jgi:hypothetical protein
MFAIPFGRINLGTISTLAPSVTLSFTVNYDQTTGLSHATSRPERYDARKPHSLSTQAE